MFLIAVVRIYVGEVDAVLQNKNPLYPAVRCITVIWPVNRSMKCQGQMQYLNPVILPWMLVGFVSVHVRTHSQRKGSIFYVCTHIYTYYITSQYFDLQASSVQWCNSCNVFGGWIDTELLQGRIKTLRLICIDFIFAVLSAWSYIFPFPPHCWAGGGAQLGWDCRVRHISAKQRKRHQHPWVVTNYRPLTRGPDWSQDPAFSVPKPNRAKLYSHLLYQTATVADAVSSRSLPRGWGHLARPSTVSHARSTEGPCCRRETLFKVCHAQIKFSPCTSACTHVTAKITSGSKRQVPSEGTNTSTLSSHNCCSSASATAPVQKSLSLQSNKTDPGASPVRQPVSHPSLLTEKPWIIWKQEENTPTLPFQPC